LFQNDIFLPFYAILRSVDNKTFGVVLMLFSIVILLFLPYCDRLQRNSSFIGFNHWQKHVFFYLWGISVITLGFIGGFPAKYPYIQFGKFFTIIYFLSYIINYIFGKYEDTRCVLMLNLSNKTKAWLIWRIWTRFKVWSNKNYNNVSKPYQTKLVKEMEKKKIKNLCK